MWFQRKRLGFKCQSCGHTFAYKRGTPFYRLQDEAAVVSQVLPLLAYGCPWVAMALMVSSRLWLGAVVSPHRDSHLIGQLAQLVRRWAQQVALLITFDGLAAYRDAFEHAFTERRRSSTSRRTQACVWNCLTLAQVVIHRVKGASYIDCWLLRGLCTMLVRLRNLSQGDGTINNAFIERLNDTFRLYLAVLVRRTHALACTQLTITHAVFLFGVVYNFCRVHSTLKTATPAMAAGLTDRVWSVADLLCYRTTAVLK